MQCPCCIVVQCAVTVAVVYVPLSAPVQQWSVVHAIWWLRISLFVASIANPPISITEALTSWQVSLTILLDSELRGINKRRNEGWENAQKGMPSSMARVAAAVHLRSLASCTLSLALKPGIFVIDVGRTPSLLDFMFSDDLVFGRVMMPLVSPKITGWSAHSNFDYSCIWVLVESWAFLAQRVLLVQCWMFHRNKQFKSFPPCGIFVQHNVHSEVLGYLIDNFVGTIIAVKIRCLCTSLQGWINNIL